MKKRSVTINGHRTSITLEQEFWDELKTIARVQNMSMNQLVSHVDTKMTQSETQNLSSALRLYVLYTLKSNNQN